MIVRHQNCLASILLLAAGLVAAGLFVAGAEAQVPRLGPEAQINSSTTGDQVLPEVAWNGDGLFVIVWRDEVSDEDSDHRLVARRAEAGQWPLLPEDELEVQGPETRLVISPPSVGFNGLGDQALIHWSDFVDSEDSSGLARVLPAGEPLRATFEVHDGNRLQRFASRVHADPNDPGTFIVAYHDVYPETGGRTFARDVDGSGSSAGPRFEVAREGYADTNAFALNQNGEFVAAYSSFIYFGDFSSTRLELFQGDWPENDTSGDTLRQYTNNYGGAILLDQPSVRPLGQSDFMIVWADRQVESGLDIRAQRLASDGSEIGAELIVAAEDAANFDRSGPRVFEDESGGFAVVWTNWQVDGDEAGIAARFYDSSGLPLTDTFQVNAYTTGRQFNPHLTSVGEGRFLVVWQSQGSPADDDDGDSILGRLIYSPFLFGDGFEDGTAGAWSESESGS